MKNLMQVNYKHQKLCNNTLSREEIHQSHIIRAKEKKWENMQIIT